MYGDVAIELPVNGFPTTLWIFYEMIYNTKNALGSGKMFTV